jgi:hypothetical protein
MLRTEEHVMDLPCASPQSLPRGWPILPVLALAGFAIICSIYANLSFLVKDTAHYRYFPPYAPGININRNDHLGGEYLNIARALRDGEGFANPFEEKTGPTAWMPPVLPVVLAGLLWVCGDDKDAVMAVVVCLQLSVLIGTGILVLALVQSTARSFWTGAAALLFVLGLVVDFFLWFQFTHDNWLVLLALDLVLAGLCWSGPVSSSSRGAGWGLCGGLCALINPIVGFTWATLTFLLAVRKKAWTPLAVAALCAGLTVTPWIVRNYLVFGRWIPVKSNLAYELYQSQCLEPDGLVHDSTFAEHPYTSAGRERSEYKEYGETVYMERKGQAFRDAVEADTQKYVDQIILRLTAATVWYVPFWPGEIEVLPPWVAFRRLIHPLPMLAMLFLVVSSYWRSLHPAQWMVIGVYVIYLLPFIAITYYDRYAAPLLAAKVLLVIWAADRILAWRTMDAETSRENIRLTAYKTNSEVYQRT